MAGAGARLSGLRVPCVAGHAYTTGVRGVPELLVVLIVYFGASAAVRRLDALFGVTGYFAAALIYLAMTALSMAGMQVLERRAARGVERAG